MLALKRDQAYDAEHRMHRVLQAEPATEAAVKTAPIPPSLPTARNLAVDAYRGLVMLLMMGEVLQFYKVSHTSATAFSGRFLPGTRPTRSGPVAPCTT